MTNLDNLKQERTKYIKAYRNCRPLSNQSNKEFLEMQKGFAKRYVELDKQIKRIQLLDKRIDRYTELLDKYGNVTTWKNIVKKSEVEINDLIEIK